MQNILQTISLIFRLTSVNANHSWLTLFTAMWCDGPYDLQLPVFIFALLWPFKLTCDSEIEVNFEL